MAELSDVAKSAHFAMSENSLHRLIDVAKCNNFLNLRILLRRLRIAYIDDLSDAFSDENANDNSSATRLIILRRKIIRRVAEELMIILFLNDNSRINDNSIS